MKALPPGKLETYAKVVEKLRNFQKRFQMLALKQLKPDDYLQVFEVEITVEHVPAFLEFVDATFLAYRGEIAEIRKRVVQAANIFTLEGCTKVGDWVGQLPLIPRNIVMLQYSDYYSLKLTFQELLLMIDYVLFACDISRSLLYYETQI